MKKVLYVMVFVMLLMIGFGCSKETKVVNTPTVAQEIDNKTLEVKSQILAPWDENRKNFWVSVYFARMSHDPNLRQRFLQHDFIPRFGGGIGVTRMISAMKKAELID